MNVDLERQIQELQAENRQLRQALEQQTNLTQAGQAAGERVRHEQTIREITTQMQTATTLKELVKITAEALNAHFSAAYTLIELGLEEMSSPPSGELGGASTDTFGNGR